MFEKTALEGMWKIVRKWGVCEECGGGYMWEIWGCVGMVVTVAVCEGCDMGVCEESKVVERVVTWECVRG